MGGSAPHTPRAWATGHRKTDPSQGGPKRDFVSDEIAQGGILNFSSCTRQPWTCVREGGAVRTWSSDSLFFFLFPFSFILNESNQLENALFEEWTFGPFLK